MEKIFLSASLREQPERIPTLTTHELSHLHLIQRIGASKTVRNIPSWFSEGLAVAVSNGGGAENVNEIDAAHAILNGLCFHPDSTGSILFPKTASSFSLKPHMFYRQSAMFVQFLREYDTEKFQNFLQTLQKGEKFKYACHVSFEKDINDFWEAFKEKLTNHST
ncbi:MAG: hypothetical protein GY705_22930 [Bacteroidetes bacterium]|nr:hypothetical protein [Bacteroidota bacterium]